MNQKQFLSQAAVALTLMLCLAGCGSKKDMGSSVSPSASVSPSPAVTEDTGDSAREMPDGASKTVSRASKIMARCNISCGAPIPFLDGFSGM